MENWTMSQSIANKIYKTKKNCTPMFIFLTEISRKQIENTFIRLLVEELPKRLGYA
jgi:hypothetical protein